MLTRREYQDWLDSRHEIAQRSIEAASMLGLAGEMAIVTLEQVATNNIATQQELMIEREMRILNQETFAEDFEARQFEFSKLLDRIAPED